MKVSTTKPSQAADQTNQQKASCPEYTLTPTVPKLSCKTEGHHTFSYFSANSWNWLPRLQTRDMRKPQTPSNLTINPTFSPSLPVPFWPIRWLRRHFVWQPWLINQYKKQGKCTEHLRLPLVRLAIGQWEGHVTKINKTTPRSIIKNKNKTLFLFFIFYLKTDCRVPELTRAKSTGS